VRNTKELVNLEQEAAMLSKQVSAREDGLLDLMGATEAARAALDSAGKRLSQVDNSWKEEQGQLLKEQAGLKQELESLSARRTDLVSEVEDTLMEVYTQAKVKGKGKAVARVEQGRCQGCYISLTVNEMQRVRDAAKGVIHCSNCGRIMHLG
jgi:predicted  nucleic acid-binding Zn-ribbon protein